MPSGPALPSTLSPQRCLVQVAFRPVLSKEAIHQQACRAQTKDGDAKVVRGDAERWAWMGTGSRKTIPPLEALGRAPGVRADACCFHGLTFPREAPPSSLESTT